MRVNDAWFAPNSGATTRPVVFEISPDVTGVVPYHGLGPTNAFSGTGSITLKGHPDVILGRGGDRRFGNSGSDPGKIEDVILQDLSFYAGIDPIADWSAAQNDSRSGTDQMPFYGQPEPADGWGQTFQNRDSLHLYNVERVVIRNCTFAYGIDEALEMFRSQGSGGRVIRDILVEHCFIGLSLRDADDGGLNTEGIPHDLHDPESFPPHNFGSLIADGDPNDPSKVQNIVFRHCVFASNDRRSPNLGIADAVTVDNCLIVHWGREGMVIRNPSSNTSVPCPTRMMFRNNLFQPGELSNLDSAIGVIRCGTTDTQLYMPGNYLISPGTANDWANDQLLTAADVNLQPSSGGPSIPDVIVSDPPYETAYSSLIAGVGTPTLRSQLYGYILGRVGPRWRNSAGNPVLGDANATSLLQWALPKIRNGTIPHISHPDDATGYTV
jgi:hypothetical protein